MASHTERSNIFRGDNAEGFKIKNLSRKKRSLESFGKDNCNPNAMKHKNSSEEYVTKWNTMINLRGKLNTPYEDISPPSKDNVTFNSFRCRKCSCWLRNCAVCLRFKCFKCEGKCVSCSENPIDCAQSEAIQRNPKKAFRRGYRQQKKTVDKINRLFGGTPIKFCS